MVGRNLTVPKVLLQSLLSVLIIIISAAMKFGAVLVN